MNSLEKQIEDIFSPQGILVQQMPGFQYRKEQHTMARGITRVFQEDAFLVAEAGTGIGKSYAYLVPAILWARQEGSKVVISTRTRALQGQIVDHDLPELAKILNQPFRYMDAKGRENYLCWNKYMNILAGRRELEDEALDFFQAVLTWAESTDTGDRKELSLPGDKMKYWPILAADRHQCLRDLCPYRDKCFRLKMLKQLEKADLIVSNHALLLSDLQMDHSILPQYEHLIIDEAHTFIRVSFEQLSRRFAYQELQRILRALFHKERQVSKGFLMHLYAVYPNYKSMLDEIRSYMEQINALSASYFNILDGAMRKAGEQSNTYVLTAQDMEAEWFYKVFDLYLEWQQTMHALLYKMNVLVKELDGEEDGVQLENFREVLQEISDTVFSIMEEDLQAHDRVVWIEWYQGQAAAVCSASIFSGENLAEKLYSQLRSLVMVSATLAVNRSFDNFIQRSGLQPYADEERVLTLLEDSPFDFERQARLFVVEDMPDPGHKQFNTELIKVLHDVLLKAGEHTLVLFTSRKQMLEVASILRPALESQDIRFLVQNEDGDFDTVMAEFKKSSPAVLFGLETFWEGIDLKGDELTCLVIVKLPFRSPQEPFSSAWDRYYRLQGKNSFQHFMLPDTAVRFKQGIGRLIRSEEDRGAIIVLDSRLVRKKYGRVLQNSIPIKEIIRVGKQELSTCLEPWL